MLCFKELAIFVLLMQKLCLSREWVPIAPSQMFQNYVSRQLQIMKPPLVSPQFRLFELNSIDFKKPKTQTFYRTALVPSQPPVYEFRYKVHDPKEENYQEKYETRVGDSVRGYYRVREPNGYIRLVKYVSDESGFQTQVSHHHSDENGGDFTFTMTRHIH